ncbi:putative amino acid transporter, transmembrane domain-containing protein [Medicago truncatula]|uniref:Putative amino acid transporter, transmembrane domain-containing protein n=1 Tax=Medicago truncatula TaxID=3880 RepID=G7J3I6_MEDTR|nr:amino acid permease 8 [Medicago truncatula]XP_024635532.1 amino acid permease 8 [Medicago truncatula]XP_024635533.1 amino acid permease 8 [Medicago truncatula]XP_024635534.1 amino acid permease 8 [Medicago truncatula]AES73893.2 transmembrane amino acid transporter family protein [Medicago truncatula]RHN70903.1 putative amino acid transporter, transmembrane domain-containing protein [Medicago truncatula]
MEAEKDVSIKQYTNEEVDDDGRIKRTGNVLTATTHIITVVVGAGVLALAWAISQLGWIAGILVMITFSSISIYTYNLIADCYRYPDSVNGKRNYTYMQAVHAYLGGIMHVFCGLIQYGKLAGITVGYTITCSTSMVAIKKLICFHKNGHEAYCKFSNNPYMLGFGIFQILLSQIPNFHKLTLISTVAAITSFGYALIGSGLSLAVVVSGKGETTSLFGTKVGPGLSEDDKIWKVLTALGNIALACSYATVVYDIMDTLKSNPPESTQMRKANMLGITTMTILFLLCGSLGYAAFGDHTPGNILTGFGFYEPFLLVALGNVCIIVHMVGAYQVLAQPIFRIVEMGANMMWPQSSFIHKEYPNKIGSLTFNINLFRLIWRTIFVIMATVIAMAMPFFNEFLALLGAFGFWPLIVFFPIQMHISQKHINRFSLKWCVLQLLSLVCFFVSVAAAVGSIHGISKNITKYKLFMYKQ